MSVRKLFLRLRIIRRKLCESRSSVIFYCSTKAPGFRSEVTENLGIFSDYQQQTGFYADVLGKATVVLPGGWEERLAELKNENGETIALCVEIHDVAVSKLMAGREKDFEFAQAAFQSDYLQIETFLERAAAILNQPASEALLPRLQKLIEKFSRISDFRKIVDKLSDFERKVINEK